MMDKDAVLLEIVRETSREKKLCEDVTIHRRQITDIEATLDDVRDALERLSHVHSDEWGEPLPVVLVDGIPYVSSTTPGKMGRGPSYRISSVQFTSINS